MMTLEMVKKYVAENVDLQGLVNEINSYNGDLEHLEFYENDEYFFELFFNNNPMEAVRACFYGDYHYMDAYVRINAYGNLETISEYRLSELLEESIDEIVDSLVNCWEYIFIDDELSEMLNELSEEEE